MHSRQIGKATLRKGTQQVQCRGRLLIDTKKAFRIRNALAGREAHGVDHVATVTRQFDPVNRLCRSGAGFCKLPGYTTDFDDGHGGSKRQNNRHLENDLEGIADVVGGKFGEAFGAVAALKKKGASLGDLAKLAFQALCFSGEHKRRHRGQFDSTVASFSESGYSGTCNIA